MSTAELMGRLQQLAGVVVEDAKLAWTVRLAKPNGIHFEVVVPKEVLEWFVTARNSGGTEIWSDWMDYAGYKRSENLEALAGEMRTDVEWFVGMLIAAAGFRVQSVRHLWLLRHKVAEWNIGGDWKRVSMAAEYNATESARA
jgi:hypothetical protein